MKVPRFGPWKHLDRPRAPDWLAWYGLVSPVVIAGSLLASYCTTSNSTLQVAYLGGVVVFTPGGLYAARLVYALGVSAMLSTGILLGGLASLMVMLTVVVQQLIPTMASPSFAVARASAIPAGATPWPTDEDGLPSRQEYTEPAIQTVIGRVEQIEGSNGPLMVFTISESNGALMTVVVPRDATVARIQVGETVEAIGYPHAARPYPEMIEPTSFRSVRGEPRENAERLRMERAGRAYIVVPLHRR